MDSYTYIPFYIFRAISVYVIKFILVIVVMFYVLDNIEWRQPTIWSMVLDKYEEKFGYMEKVMSFVLTVESIVAI